jgi:hypothetical protein
VSGVTGVYKKEWKQKWQVNIWFGKSTSKWDSWSNTIISQTSDRCPAFLQRNPGETHLSRKMGVVKSDMVDSLVQILLYNYVLYRDIVGIRIILVDVTDLISGSGQCHFVKLGNAFLVRTIWIQWNLWRGWKKSGSCWVPVYTNGVDGPSGGRI